MNTAKTAKRGSLPMPSWTGRSAEVLQDVGAKMPRSHGVGDSVPQWRRGQSPRLLGFLRHRFASVSIVWNFLLAPASACYSAREPLLAMKTPFCLSQLPVMMLVLTLVTATTQAAPAKTGASTTEVKPLPPLKATIASGCLPDV